MKVLIADTMSAFAERIFTERGFTVDVKTGMAQEELIKSIPDYQALVVRSSTQVTKEVILAGNNLRVIGRAGIGVDNIQVDIATHQGIVVMNTPYGNATTTAEHAISLLFSTARQIPFANETMHKGKWEKSSIKGVEITGKTLGIIGCGNIGAIVAEKALGLHMNVMVYDPYLTEEKAKRLGVYHVSFDTLIASADFITVHVPLTEHTHYLINEEVLKKTKKGVRIINCARGGIVDEKALQKYLVSGHVASAALDAFEQEPLPQDSPLFNTKNLILTPHLGASTVEAQEKVVVEIAHQISDYLLSGTIVNSVNTVSISKKEHQELAPYKTLIFQMASFIGQIVNSGIHAVMIECYGKASTVSTMPLMHTALHGLLSPITDSINYINAATIAHQRGIKTEMSVIDDEQCEYNSLIRLKVKSDTSTFTIAGTLFGNLPRIVSIKDIKVEVEFGMYNLYTVNQDAPGFINSLTRILANHTINIASFHLGRHHKGGEAVTVVVCDDVIDHATLQEIQNLPLVVFVAMVSFGDEYRGC